MTYVSFLVIPNLKGLAQLTYVGVTSILTASKGHGNELPPRESMGQLKGRSV